LGVRKVLLYVGKKSKEVKSGREEGGRKKGEDWADNGGI